MVNIETSCDELSEKKRKTNVVRFEASEHERNKVDLRKHESKDGKLHSLPLYCVAFSKDKYFDDSDGREFFCFATCGDLKVVIYEVEANNPDGIFRAKQTYRENKDIDEQFNTCVFAGRSRAASRHSEKGPQLLMIGGRSGIIRAIDTWQNRQISELEFNTAEIFDLKVCPSNEYLLLSCADDGNICLWNLESFACAAVFGGKHGHEHAVLSISWHPLGLHFASGGKDRTVRLWRIDGDKVSEAIEASKGLGLGLRQRFRPFLQNFPYFVTGKLHPNYVDCVQWLGNMILSKSTNNKILLWMPDLSNAKKVRVANYTPPDDVTVLRTFRLRNCNLWFMRFAIDNMGKYLACGMLNGEVEIWNIDESTSEEPCQRLPYIEEATMRMLAFSPDGNFLVGCTDDASICRWNLR